MRMGAAGRIGAIALAAAVLVVGAVASPAVAGGGVVVPKGTDAALANESAIVSWDGNEQRIELMLSMTSAAAETGLIFPTPTPATVTEGDRAHFDELEATIEPRISVRNDWWGLAASRNAAAEKADEPVSTVQLGPLEATTIGPSESADVTDWIDDNDFRLSSRAKKQLALYASAGWSFVALKLSADAAIDGALDPIVFSFPSNRLVYPMRFSAASSAPQSLRLYVLDDHRAQLRQYGHPSRQLNAAQSVAWAGSVAGTDLAERGDYLTVLDVRYDTPRSQVKGDIAIVDAIADTEIIPATVTWETRSLLGLPVGILVAGWLGLGLLFGVAWVIARLRVR